MITSPPNAHGLGCSTDALTLEVALKGLLRRLVLGLELDETEGLLDVKNHLGLAGFAFVGIFAFGRWVGTLQFYSNGRD